MKKLLLTTLIASNITIAHDMWADAPEKIKANTILSVALGYGDFPLKEPIPAKRLHIFPPMQIIDMQGNVKDLKQQGENYQFVTPMPLAKGNYWVTATYRPTFWSQDNKGKWAMQNMKKTPNATYCESTQMFSKSLVLVDDKLNKDFVTHPIGQDLEIVTLADPKTVKSGKTLPIQVFYKGEPLSGATLTATSDTFVAKDEQARADHIEPQAFSAKTNSKGQVNFIPLIDGLWKLKVIHKTPYKDSKVCQHNAYYATLVIPVGKTRAKLSPVKHNH